MKKRILDGATAELEQHGTSFRMDDLATRLGMSKRTIYEHFRSKDEIIEALLTDWLDELHRHHRSVLEDTKADFRTTMRAYFSADIQWLIPLSSERVREMFDNYPHLIELAIREGESQWARFGEYLEARRREGIVRESTDTATLILMLKGLVNGILYDKESDPALCLILLDKAIEMLLDGIEA